MAGAQAALVFAQPAALGRAPGGSGQRVGGRYASGHEIRDCLGQNGVRLPRADAPVAAGDQPHTCPVHPGRMGFPRLPRHASALHDGTDRGQRGGSGRPAQRRAHHSSAAGQPLPATGQASGCPTGWDRCSARCRQPRRPPPARPRAGRARAQSPAARPHAPPQPQRVALRAGTGTAAGLSPAVMTPPLAITLTRSAPRSTRSRTAARSCSGPVASPPMFAQCPSRLVMGGPDATIAGAAGSGQASGPAPPVQHRGPAVTQVTNRRHTSGELTR